MGILHYGANTFEMDDRLLSHLQLVIGVKLRRGENFFMGWRDAARTAMRTGRCGSTTGSRSTSSTPARASPN